MGGRGGVKILLVWAYLELSDKTVSIASIPSYREDIILQVAYMPWNY